MRSNTTALLLLLLLLLASSAIAHVNFLDFSSNGRATGVKFDTGYNLNAVQVVWEKYGRRLIHAVELYKGFRVARSQGACALEDDGSVRTPIRCSNGNCPGPFCQLVRPTATS